NLDRGCGKTNSKTGKEINDYLDEVRLIIKGHYKDLELSGTKITVDALKDLYLGNVKEEPGFTFECLITYHNEQGRTLLAAGTMRHYLVTQRYLVKFFQQKFNKIDFNLADLDFKFISDFEYSCTTTNRKTIKNRWTRTVCLNTLYDLRK
ncbi:MAG: hypothetical protein EOP48_16755, partial [Sphingobacteriales bacterium]